MLVIYVFIFVFQKMESPSKFAVVKSPEAVEIRKDLQLIDVSIIFLLQLLCVE